MNYKLEITSYKKDRGVSLFITLVVMATILGAVLGISSILVSQMKMMRGIGESVVAFYTADSGIEKTYYFDRKKIPDGGNKGLCNICNVCTDCQNCIVSGDDCAPQSCLNCEISFFTNFNGKEYKINTAVNSTDRVSEITIRSFGSYKEITRAIELSYVTEIPVSPGLYSDPNETIECHTLCNPECYEPAHYYQRIDDGEREPDTEGLTNDYVLGDYDGYFNVFGMTDVDIEEGTVTEIEIWVYINFSDYGENDWAVDISPNEGDNWVGAQEVGFQEGTPGWYSATFSELSYDQTDINELYVKTILVTNGTVISMDAMYAEITY